MDHELKKITLFYESQERELLDELAELESNIKAHEEAGLAAARNYYDEDAEDEDDDDDDDDDDNSTSPRRSGQHRRRKSSSVGIGSQRQTS